MPRDTQLDSCPQRCSSKEAGVTTQSAFQGKSDGSGKHTTSWLRLGLEPDPDLGVQHSFSCSRSEALDSWVVAQNPGSPGLPGCSTRAMSEPSLPREMPLPLAPSTPLPPLSSLKLLHSHSPHQHFKLYFLHLMHSARCSGYLKPPITITLTLLRLFLFARSFHSPVVLFSQVGYKILR